MFESYYRFLGGPRTFWGHGGSFVNNFYMGNPQHHCHGDNGMSKLMGWAYVFNMMQNMVRPQQQVIYPPYQPQVYSPQQSMYPYVNFSGREGAGGVAGNQQVNADLANLYNLYKDDGVKFGMIGDSIQARTKDGTVYKASNVEELADKLAEAGATGKKDDDASLGDRLKTSDNAGGSGDADGTGNAGNAGGAGNADGTGNAGNAGNAGGAGDADGTGNAGGAGNVASGGSNKCKRQGWYRTTGSSNPKWYTDNLDAMKKDNDPISKIIMTKVWKLGNTIDKQKLRQDIIKQNPSVFDESGKIKPNADITKLDLPTIATINKDYKGTSSAPSGGSNTKDLGNNCKVENGKFYINGKETSNVEFAEKYPDKFFANEPKSYKKDELVKLLDLYHSKISQSEADFTFKIDNDWSNNKQVHIEVDYPGGWWTFRSGSDSRKYEIKESDGILRKSIKEIYEDLTKTYFDRS